MSRAHDVGHACWSFDDPRPFDEYARAFLTAGLAAGERVWYVAGPRFDATANWLRGIETVRPDTVRVVDVTEAYFGDQAIDPRGQIEAWAAESRAATAAGFHGMRVVADVTSLVRTPAQREAFGRYEYYAGRLMRTEPLQGLCGFDRAQLGDRAVAELACLHDTSFDVDVPFRLYPGRTRATAVLDGELDLSAEELFSGALRYTELEPCGGEVIVDAGNLQFLDHQSLLTLHRFAEARQVTAVIRTRLAMAGHLAGMLRLPHVRVEVG